jgi:putative sporulation protein YtaF
MLFDLMQALLLVFAVSADAFVSSFAYGAKKIKIPFVSVIVISAISAAFLAVSLFAGEFIRGFLSESTAGILCFLILFTLGLVKLLDNAVKALIKKRNKHINGQLKFKLLNFNFILNVYANPEDADSDRSNVLSPGEAVSLSIALSLDGLAAGIGTALGGANKPLIIALALAVGILAITLGSFTGNKAADKSKAGFSWLGGAVLIVLAVFKLV